MPKIFGRVALNTHPCEKDLVKWEVSKKHEIRAVAINLRCDHRITPDREREFMSFLNNEQSLSDALKSYYKYRIKLNDKPDFILPNLNRENCVFGFSETENLIGTKEQLVNVLSLNGLIHVFQACVEELEDFGFNERRGFEKPNTDELNSDKGFGDWLNRMLKNASPGKQENFVKSVFDLMNYYKNKKEGYYNAIWVSKWDDFEPFINDGANVWVQVLGVKRDMGTWQIILKYPVGAAEKIVRPTQLESGDYAYHFPSPENTPKKNGGHPMNLGIKKSLELLLSEFVHVQIDYDISYWVDAGRKIDVITENSCEIGVLRQNHFNLLVKKYGDPIRKWMPDAI